jgi:uncharacterized protein (TIGR01244 family)
MAALSEIYNFLPLTEDLLTSGQPTREQFSLIAAVGVKTVINLALQTSSSALPEEETLVKSLGMNYVHIPVIWESPTRANLESFFFTMEAQSGEKVFVHCAANMRVSAFVALYRILRLGWDRNKAFQSTYYIWDPFTDEVWGKFIELALAK